MEFTIIGIVAVLVVFFAIFKQKKDILLYAAVFFTGFTGSSVINISGVSIQPSYFFFILYFIVIVYQGLTSTKKKRVEFPKMFTIFLVYCALTLICTVIVQNNEIIILSQKDKYENLTFSLSNIIHVGYMLLCYLFYVVLINRRERIKLRENLFKAYRYGVIAVIIICLYQLLAFQWNLPFDIIFRQGVHGNVQGRRIYGPCIEASFLSYYLAPSLFLLLLNIDKHKRDFIWIALGIIIGVLCYSSTFFVGLVLSVICLIVRFAMHAKDRRTVNYFIGLMTITATIIIAIVFRWDDVDKVITEFVDKIGAKNVSGSIRTEAFQRMSIIGFQYPFGVGFGSSRSKDLLSTWMCNIGIVGVLIFTAMLISYMNKCLKKNRFFECLPFIICMILAGISVPEPYNLFIWLLMFFGMYGTEGKKIAKSRDGIDGQLYQLWWN